MSRSIRGSAPPHVRDQIFRKHARPAVAEKRLHRRADEAGRGRLSGAERRRASRPVVAVGNSNPLQCSSLIPSQQRPNFSANPMRCSLPVAPFGISARKRIFLGVLNAANRSDKNDRSSPSVAVAPSRNTTAAAISSRACRAAWRMSQPATPPDDPSRLHRPRAVRLFLHRD